MSDTVILLLIFSVHSLFLVFRARAPANLTTQEILLGLEPGNGRTAAVQAGFQLALLASTLLISIVGGIITGKGYALHSLKFSSFNNFIFSVFTTCIIFKRSFFSLNVDLCVN